MPKYQSQDGNVIDVANPDLNPQLIAGLKQVPDNTIPVSTLMANNQPIPVTQPQTTPVYPVGGIDTSIPTPTLTAPEQGISDVIKQITDLQNYTVGKTAYKSTQETAQGLPALLDTQKSLSKQILALQAEAKNIPDQAQVDATGRGVTAGGLAPLTTGALRENSIKANILNAQLAASQLDIASANTAVDKAVAMKFGPIEETLKAKLANLDILLKDPSISLAEKNRVNAQALLLKQQEAQVAQQKDNYDAAHKLSNEAATNLANFKSTAEFPVANAALDAIRRAADKGNQTEVSRIAAETGLTKPQTSQSDFEQAFLRDKGRLPTTQELVDFKQKMAIAGRPITTITGTGGGQVTGLTSEQSKILSSKGLTSIQAENVAGIYNGLRPPVSGFGVNSKEGMAVTAGLNALGYNLTKASEDWTAMQKRIATMNGTQQVRLQQAINFSYDSLDIIDQLNNEWKGGNFPLLNKASLSLAKNGAYGQEAQSLATRFDAQINDLTSELGTVYKGGNSSTDESLKLAAGNLKSNWSQKTLQDAINLARTNLQIRKNSIQASSNMPGNIYDQNNSTIPSVDYRAKYGY